MKTENFVIITFDDEKKAIEASHKLQDMDIRGDIILGYSVILRKGANGKIEALKKTSVNGSDTWTGMFVGSLVGLFLGPLGFLISMLAGTAVGAGIEYSKDKFEDGFVDTVKSHLENGKTAIIANCDESNPIFLDEAIKDFGGEITRSMAKK